MIAGVTLSACWTFRYRLWRQWAGGSRLVFVMLNPSTADATVDDPTIRKCIGFAKRLGYDGIEVVNLFAYRATDPADLKRAGWPVGPENDNHIRAACSRAPLVICAWGANAVGHPRVVDVLNLLHDTGRDVCALKINRDGTPAHPLMLPYSANVVPFDSRSLVR